MNLDEMIADYEKREATRFCGNIAMVAVSKVITDLKMLSNVEYNRKVKLPQFMASWIKDENIKSSSFDGILNDAIFNYQFHSIGDESIKDWILRNPMKLKNALDNGYEVEEEPLWEVPILSLMTSDGKQQYLSYDERQNTYFASRKWELIKQTFTDDELTKIPSQYKKYALPVEEVNNG